MRDNAIIRYSVFLFLGILVLTSCNEDDDNPPSGTSYPITMTFSGVTDTEFRMWTNGVEVITDNLNVQDFMDPDDWEFLRPEYYEDANATFSFDEDSIFSTDPMNGLTGYPYEFRNDSLFITNQFIFDGDTTQIELYLAAGNLNQIVLNQGFFEYCNNQGIITDCNSALHQQFLNIQNLEEDFNQENIVASLESADTIFIYNQRIVFN